VTFYSSLLYAYEGGHDVSISMFSLHVVVDNSFWHVLRVTQWLDSCVPWQIFFVGVFVWALAPFVCLVCFSLTKRKSGWGFAGRLAGLCGFGLL